MREIERERIIFGKFAVHSSNRVSSVNELGRIDLESREFIGDRLVKRRDEDARYIC